MQRSGTKTDFRVTHPFKLFFLIYYNVIENRKREKPYAIFVKVGS